MHKGNCIRGVPEAPLVEERLAGPYQLGFWGTQTEPHTASSKYGSHTGCSSTEAQTLQRMGRMFCSAHR